MRNTILAKKRDFFRECRSFGLEPNDYLKFYCENSYNLAPFLAYSDVLYFVEFAQTYFKKTKMTACMTCEQLRTQKIGDWLHNLIFNEAL